MTRNFTVACRATSRGSSFILLAAALVTALFIITPGSAWTQPCTVYCAAGPIGSPYAQWLFVGCQAGLVPTNPAGNGAAYSCVGGGTTLIARLLFTPITGSCVFLRTSDGATCTIKKSNGLPVELMEFSVEEEGESADKAEEEGGSADKADE